MNKLLRDNVTQLKGMHLFFYTPHGSLGALWSLNYGKCLHLYSKNTRIRFICPFAVLSWRFIKQCIDVTDPFIFKAHHGESISKLIAGTQRAPYFLAYK